MSGGGPMLLGVLVPCRNEARVIARRLANLAACDWPAGTHRLVVVDDGSQDGSGELAARACAERFDARRVTALTVTNRQGPGKAGALRTGLEELAGCDLVVLTDADVVTEPQALIELARAFEREPELGMACGAQRFVRDLAADGTPAGADGGPPRDAAGSYDRVTARVRALESRCARLFSVHGQLLAWRASLGLAPRDLAADDLDLMLQARARGARVRLVPAARFLEVKLPPGPEREAQALRRARAYVQCMRACGASVGQDALTRAQTSLYRILPTATPWLCLALCAALPLVAARLWGGAGALVTVALVLAGVLSPPGRRLVRLLRVIARAARLERRATLPARWETAR